MLYDYISEDDSLSIGRVRIIVMLCRRNKYLSKTINKLDVIISLLEVEY